jgi:hypothetical protein
MRTTHVLKRRFSAIWLFVSLVALVVGCGGGGADGTDVTGVVTHNGAPVPQGTIAFIKSGSPAAGGPIGSDGSYTLTLPPGQYQVRIDAIADTPDGWTESDPMPPRIVPEKFANFETSGLTLTVGDESPQQHDVKLP